MNDELVARHRAITLRIEGRSVQAICAAVGRTEVWFYKWWRRYLEAGPEALYDLTRANHHVARRIPPELERAILSIRRRLQAHATPATRCTLTGAAAILAELKALGVRPLPCGRTTWASLMCRLPHVRLQLRENSMMGLGRSAGEAQQGAGSWLGSVSYSTAVHQVESRKPRISRENQWPQVQIEPRNRFVRQSLIHNNRQFTTSA